MPPPNTAIFTDQEIEKMRTFVNEHDKSRSVNDFDLNKPPQKPYVHQDWPKAVYSIDAKGVTVAKKVADAREHDAAIADGWTNEPQGATAAEDVELDDATKAEIAAFDAKIAAAKLDAAKKRKIEGSRSRRR
jgi:uncharacterized membrane protein YqiK